MEVDLDQMPIVDSGALDRMVVDAKAEWLDQVKRAGRRGTGAGHGARVWRNLGLHQHDAKWLRERGATQLGSVRHAYAVYRAPKGMASLASAGA